MINIEVERLLQSDLSGKNGHDKTIQVVYFAIKIGWCVMRVTVEKQWANSTWTYFSLIWQLATSGSRVIFGLNSYHTLVFHVLILGTSHPHHVFITHSERSLWSVQWVKMVLYEWTPQLKCMWINFIQCVSWIRDGGLAHPKYALAF